MARDMASDLMFLLDREEVNADFADKLKENGINTVAKFGALVDTQPQMRSLLKDEFDYDETKGMKIRGQIASILVAWSVAKKRSERQAELDVDNEARN